MCQVYIYSQAAKLPHIAICLLISAAHLIEQCRIESPHTTLRQQSYSTKA